MTFTIFTGKNGDPNQPVPWADFAAYLAGQWGLMASPTWLDAVDADPTMAAQPVGTGPFIFESYAPRDRLVVTRNPDYWMTDAQGNQLPYLDSIEFRVIEDSETAAGALQSGDIDIFATSSARVIADFREQRRVRHVRPGRARRDELHPHRPVQGQRPRRPAGALRAVDGDRPAGAHRRRQRRHPRAGQRPVLARPAGPPRGQRPADGAGPRGRGGADRGVRVRDRPAGRRSSSATRRTGSTTRVPSCSSAGGRRSASTPSDQQVPQDQFITLALFGDPTFEAFLWRQHAGVSVDQQYFWWHSAGSHPDGELSLNFGRLNVPEIDEALDAARSSLDEAERNAAAEDGQPGVRRGLLLHPAVVDAVVRDRRADDPGHRHARPARRRRSPVTAPGSPGQFWTQTVFVDEG